MWIVFAHVVTVFIGFALTFGVGVILTQIVQSGDVRSIRIAVNAAIPTQTTTKLGFDLRARWLSISMILVALLLLDGFGRRYPRLLRLAKAANDSPVDAPSQELRRLMIDRFEG